MDASDIKPEQVVDSQDGEKYTVYRGNLKFRVQAHQWPEGHYVLRVKVKNKLQ